MADVWLIDQSSVHATRETILIVSIRARSGIAISDANAPLLMPTRATVSLWSVASVETETAKIDRKLLLQAADDDLENAVQVLALADRAGDLMEQVQPLELRLGLLFSLPAAVPNAVTRYPREFSSE